MNLPWLAGATAFAIAFLFTWMELRTSKDYSNTGFLLWSSGSLWIYCSLYGLIALAGFLLSNLLITNSILTIQGLGLQSPYVRALVLGVSSKAIMQLNLFTVTSGPTPIPIGFQTIVQIFEPFLLYQIKLAHWVGVNDFVAPFAAKYPDLNQVKTKIKQNIPPFISADERGAFANEIDKDQRVEDAMARYLRSFGKKAFLSVFP
jgi:hypothetical protein